MASLTDINSNILGSFNISGIMRGIGWLIFAILLVAIGVYVWWMWYDKRQWQKRITRFELISGSFQPTLRDKAKTVKLGKGGFEVLFWKKAKVYRIAFGGRTGKNDYYFFQAPDGYDYNGTLSGQLTADGKVPIIVTNPNMRAQYTALEKQIDSLHGQKQSLMDKYGSWILGISFVLIIGIFAYLFFKQYHDVVGAIPGLVDQMAKLVDKVNQLLVSANAKAGGASLTPA